MTTLFRITNKGPRDIEVRQQQKSGQEGAPDFSYPPRTLGEGESADGHVHGANYFIVREAEEEEKSDVEDA